MFPKALRNKEFTLEVIKQNWKVIFYAINVDPSMIDNDLILKVIKHNLDHMLSTAGDVLKQTFIPNDIRARFKKELSQVGAQNLTEEQLQKIDGHIQVLEKEIEEATRDIAVSRKKEHIDVLMELKTLSKTKDVLSAIEEIDADDRFSHVKAGTGSRTRQLIDEIKCECSERHLRR